jgi:hypothetical protein
MADHPITPPPELFKQWEGQPRSIAFEAAYRAGADMELEACCEWADVTGWVGAGSVLRRFRRPKPPSLKRLALDQLKALELHGALACNVAHIRRALEALPE